MPEGAADAGNAGNTGNGAGGGAAAGSPSLIDIIDSDPNAGAAGGAKPPAAAKPAEDGRPAFLPEKFWDKEAKAPRVEDLAKSYASLEAEHSRKLKGHAGAPEAYEFAVPDELAGQIEVDMEAGFTADAVKLFKKHGITQEAAQELVGLYLMQAHADMTGATAEELTKLGPDARQTIQAVNDWARVNLSAEEYQAVRSGCNSAASVLAVKALIQRIEGKAKVPTSELERPVYGNEAARILAEEVGSPRYMSEEAYREQVDARLNAALGGQ